MYSKFQIGGLNFEMVCGRPGFSNFDWLVVHTDKQHEQPEIFSTFIYSVYKVTYEMT